MSSITNQTPALGDLLTHTEWTRRLARSLAHDDAHADDAVQDTLLAALRKPPAGDRPLRPWIGSVVRHLVAKSNQSERRRAARHARAALATPAVCESSEDMLVRAEMQHRLVALVAELDEPYRQTLLLRYFEGHASAQIARMMDLPAGTVRWRLKSALDQLRARLDEGQAREDWKRALAPLLLPVRGARRLATILAAALGASLLAGLVLPVALLLHGHGRDATSQDGRERPGRLARWSAALGTGGPAVPGAPGGEGSSRHWAAAVGGDLGACQREVERLRPELARAELDHLRGMHPEQLFALGQPNPAAENELGPIIDRILKGDHPAAPSHVLECHTDACRLLVLQNTDEARRTAEWQPPLQRDPEMRARTRGMGFGSGPPTTDPVSKVDLQQRRIFIRLADSSGKPVAAGQQPGLPPSTTKPLPSDLAACRAERAAIGSALATVRSEIDRDLHPPERYVRNAPNPALTAEIDAEVRRIFGPADPARPAIDCRGAICRATFSGADLNGPRRRMETDPVIRSRVDEMSVGGPEAYFVMAPGPRTNVMEHLKKLVTAFQASGALGSCYARHPQAGTLRVQLLVPKTGDKNEDGDEGKIAVRYASSLDGTPAGRCIADEIARTILAAPLPAPIGMGVMTTTFTLPPGAAQAPPL
jgi:RNA polymerase sigma-70 factor (ECF subfamily)